MKTLIKFNARFNYLYYNENGGLIGSKDFVIEKLAKEAGYEIIEEGDGTWISRDKKII